MCLRSRKFPFNAAVNKAKIGCDKCGWTAQQIACVAKNVANPYIKSWRRADYWNERNVRK